MPSAAVPGHYEIFYALQNKTKQNKTVKTVKTLDFLKKSKLLKNERRQTLTVNKSFTI